MEKPRRRPLSKIGRKDFIANLTIGTIATSLIGCANARPAAPGGVVAANDPNAAKITFIGTSHGAVTPWRFSSCTLLQYGGKNYVIDAADGAVGRIMQCGVKIPDLDAVFITHPHGDHFGGLSMLLVQHSFQNDVYRGKLKEKKPIEVLLPGPELLRTITEAHKLPYVGQLANYQHIRKYAPGVIFDDGTVKVTAYGNDHMGRRKDGTQYAHSLLFELSNGKRIYFSGDVSREFDLPLEPMEKGRIDLLVCELVHYPIEKAVERLKGRAIDKICFQHYGDQWEASGWEKRFAAFVSQLTMPAERVADLDVRVV